MEAPDIGKMLERMARALVRRTAGGELEALVVLYRIRSYVDDQLAAAFLAAAEYPYDHPTIAGELGIRTSAVQQRVAKARAAEQHHRRTA